MQADAEALRSAAPALNKFPTDGSFLDTALGDKATPRSNPLRAALQAGRGDRQSPCSSPEHMVDDDGGGGNGASTSHLHESSTPGRLAGERGGQDANMAGGSKETGVERPACCSTLRFVSSEHALC